MILKLATLAVFSLMTGYASELLLHLPVLLLMALVCAVTIATKGTYSLHYVAIVLGHLAFWHTLKAIDFWNWCQVHEQSIL